MSKKEEPNNSLKVSSMEIQNKNRPRKKGFVIARWAIRIVPVVVSVVLLAILLSHFSDYSILLRINIPIFIFGAIVSILLNLFLSAYKWQRVLSLSNIRIPYWEAWRMWAGLTSISIIMPFQSSGILYGLILKKKKELNYVEAFEGTGYDRYLFLMGTLVFVVAGQFFLNTSHSLSQYWILAGAVAAIGFYFLDYWAFKAISRIGFLERRSRLIHKKIGLMEKLYLLFLSTLCQSSDIICMYLAILCLGIEVNFLEVMGIYSIIMMLTIIPVTLNGFGAREGLIALWMANFLSFDQAIASALIFNLFEFAFPTLVGLVAVRQNLQTLFGGHHSKIKEVS